MCATKMTVISHCSGEGVPERKKIGWGKTVFGWYFYAFLNDNANLKPSQLTDGVWQKWSCDKKQQDIH